MTTLENPDIGHLIKMELSRQGRSVSWLASQIGCTRQNMNYLLNRSFIYTDLLLRISEVLDHDFFQYYSNHWKAKHLSKYI